MLFKTQFTEGKIIYKIEFNDSTKKFIVEKFYSKTSELESETDEEIGVIETPPEPPKVKKTILDEE